MPHPDLDTRIALTQPPAGRSPILYQSWEHLLFLHWSVDAELIQKTLPPGLTVDTYDDRAWLGIVPFYMRGLRPRFCPPMPGLSNFLELNLRTYVYDHQGQPGVWFYSLDANQWIAVKIAQTGFSLPYIHARIHSTVSPDKTIHFRCNRPNQDSLIYDYQPGKAIGKAVPGSLDFFLVERYCLFAYKRKQLYRGRIHHAPYELTHPEVATYSSSLFPLNGFPDPGCPPQHAVTADRIDVTVYGLEAIAK